MATLRFRIIDNENVEMTNKDDDKYIISNIEYNLIRNKLKGGKR